MAPDETPDPAAETAAFAHALYVAGRGARTFVHPDARTHWSVVEVHATNVPGARGRSRCLVFVSTRVVRRVWEYPEEWYLLGDADLAAVSEGV